jgi:Zn-finger protein
MNRIKILWTKSGHGVCEGHRDDQLCPKCGHETLRQVWESNTHWNGYDYDGRWIWECRYCQLLKKEDGFLEEPQTTEQIKHLTILLQQHKDNRFKLKQEKDRLKHELSVVVKRMKEFGY